MLERARDILRRLHGNPAGAITQPAVTPELPKPSVEYISDWDDLIQRPVGPDPKNKPFDDQKVLAEVKLLVRNLRIAAERYGGTPIGMSLADGKRYTALEQTFAEGIEPIQSIQRKELDEVGETGSDSWVRVAHTQVMEIGSEIMTRRNIQQRLALARKYHAEGSSGPYLELLQFYHGLVTSIRIGEITLQDFINPQDSSLVGRYRFLTHARLMVHRNLYDEVLQDNTEPPKDTYPNMIRGTLWALPARAQALLVFPSVDLEHAYKDAWYPLNEIGMLAAKVVKGAQETRIGVYKTLLNPRSEHFQALKQVLTGYLFDNDRIGLFLVLIQLGLQTVDNTRQLYRQARKYSQTGMEVEFFTKLGNSIRDYIKELSTAASLPTENDMDLVSDLDKPIDPTAVPTFEQLGLSVSGIFQRSSQIAYTVNPEGINWPLAKAQSITVQFDKNRPRKFDIALVFESEDGEETTEVNYSIDATRRTMDWEYAVDPMLPENERIATFRSLLLISTQAVLREIQGQADEQYQTKAASRETSTMQVQRVKRERFEDPIYAIRKEIKAEQRQAEKERIKEDEIAVAEIMESANIKNEIEVPEGKDLKKLLRHISPEDGGIAVSALQEFNEFSTGLELTKKRKSGPDGTERWTGRFACTVPRGGRILITPSKFAKGSRKFRIIDIRYRKDVYPKNKL